MPLAAFTIPLHNRLNVIVLLVVLIVWVFDGPPAEKFRRIRSDKACRKLLWMTVIYLLYAVGLFYSSNLRAGFFNLEVKLSLLLVPMVYATMSHHYLNGKTIRDISNSFVAGTFLATLICLGKAVWDYLGGEGGHVFYYSYLSYYHHASYLSMYIVFSLAVIYFNFFDGKKQNGLPLILFFTIVSLFFTAFIFLLSSKAGLLSFAGLIFIIAIHNFFFRKNRRKGIIILLAGWMASFIFLSVFPYAMHRIGAAASNINSEGSAASEESTAERVFIWKAALDVVSHHWLTGVGTGDVQDVLNRKYNDRGNSYAAGQYLNAHNQYLQTWLSLGLPGLLTLLMMLILPLHRAFRPDFRVYLCFILLFAGNLLFESMLEKQAGVVFYAFFNSVFFLAMQKSDC